jgi:hypothetical protein
LVLPEIGREINSAGHSLYQRRRCRPASRHGGQNGAAAAAGDTLPGMLAVPRF